MFSHDLSGQFDIWASAVAAGGAAAKRANGFAGWQLGHRHDVSILIASIGPCGRCRGVEPRAKVSMMIMRPLQCGHGSGLLSSVASAGSAWGVGTASSSRARAMLSAQAALANRP